MSDPVKDAVGSIAEIQFDLIARVVPGFAVIAAVAWYNGQSFPRAAETGSALFFGGASLIAAYIVGFLLDYGSGEVERWVLRLDKDRDDDALWEYYHQCAGDRKKVVLKILGERAMCRTLCMVSLLFLASSGIREDWRHAVCAMLMALLCANGYRGTHQTLCQWKSRIASPAEPGVSRQPGPAVPQA